MVGELAPKEASAGFVGVSQRSVGVEHTEASSHGIDHRTVYLGRTCPGADALPNGCMSIRP